jgi:hypothetical protein
MTPKEKSEYLVNKYKPYVYPYVGSSYLTGDEYPEQILSYAKKCASIAADEILSLFVHECADTIYWTEVKKEIEKI